MNRVPLKIENCPIEEAIFEVRFSSGFPSEAVFGVFYQILNQNFPGAALIPQPILQLPEAVRQSDPILIYQAHHRLQNGNQGINIGPRVLTFSNLKPYLGWKDWSVFIERVITQLVAAKAFGQVERTGLRYINFFERSLFEIADVEVKVTGSQLDSQSTTVRSEILDQGDVKILQFSNNVNITFGGRTYTGSVLDIDVLRNLGVDNDSFGQALSTILDESHRKEKELFFNILRQEYIQTLSPSYEA
jgi:uncharacterized protein (TIGR04255 family)